jgi:hypothetical protein
MITMLLTRLRTRPWIRWLADTFRESEIDTNVLPGFDTLDLKEAKVLLDELTR